MSEKFSVEDILKEVKSMTGDHYYANEPKDVAPKSDEPDSSFAKENSVAEDKSADSAFMKKADEPKEEIKADKPAPVSPFDNKNESFLPDDIDTNDNDDDDEEIDISKMSTEEFFNMLETGSTKHISTVEPSPKKAKKSIFKKADKKQEEKAEEPENNIENTVVYDKKELESALEESKNDAFKPKKAEPVAEKQDAEEQTVVSGATDGDIADNDVADNDMTESAVVADENAAENDTENASELGGLKVKRAHKPEHLLKPEEIINNSMNEAPSFRFSDRVKDLTKSKKNTEQAKSSFTPFKKPAEEEIKAADEFFDKVSENYAKQEKEKAEPNVLNNEIKENVAETAEPMPIEVKKEIAEEDVSKAKDENKAYAKKTMRRIKEVSFDYSEDKSQEEEVIDDYTSIEDEEPVRSDLDISFAKITKRLTFNIIAFIVAFVFSVLPQFDINLISAVSPKGNLTGFLVLNAAIMFVTLLINISNFFRGLGSLVTFKPDSDSPMSVASLFVAAQAVIALIPQFSTACGKLPFFTAAVSFGYVLTLFGKKSMVARIRSNFRLVATTTPKQACFVADEQFSEMLENDDFVGTPNVATSKSVLNLHNYLRNSYCEDPSDNISRIFAPLSLIAAVVTLVVTYILSSDMVSAVFYATAVAMLGVPASAIWAVSAPLKKVSDIARHREGIISGYNAVNEFSDVDCVAIDAEDIFPAGSVELLSLRAIGDASIEDVILKSAALTINAGGPLADVFDKIIDGRRKMLPPISDIVYEDGLGLSGKVEGKIVRIGNRNFIDSYGIYGLSDDSIEQKAKKGGFFIVYTAVDDEVCGMFAVKYKSIDPDIEDSLFALVDNGITLALKTNDPNITPELIERVFEIPSDYVVVMEAHTAECFDDITKPAKNGDGVMAFSGNSSVFAKLVVACKKLQKKISVAVLIQSILTILGFGACMLGALTGNGTEYITPFYVIAYQFAVALISLFIPSVIKRIK